MAGKKSAKQSEQKTDNTENIAMKADFDQLCRELNMDTSTADSAWNSYTEMKHKYTLEGDQIHWLACALYVACRNSTLPTVGDSGNTVQGNGVSLTRLLRSSKLSLIEFFNKAQKWADMANVQTEFREKIVLLEKNFNVSSVIFKKYQNIFVGLFKDPANDPPKVKQSRKTKKPPCTPGEVFEFCWGLFIRVKALCPDISNDLVNSYHLLIACVDHIYACAFMAERQDLMNPDFQGKTEFQTDGRRPCVVDALCSLHDGIVKEVKAIREHWWRRRIHEMFDQKVLKGNTDNLTGLLEVGHFDYNVKSIRKEYEAYVLSIGEYDERVFLGDDAEEDIGTPAATSGTGSTAQKSDESNLDKQIAGWKESGTRLIPMTPLSGKHLIIQDKDGSKPMTPITASTNLVVRLHKLIGNLKKEPSKTLAALIASINKASLAEEITARIKEMGQVFLDKYTTPNVDHPGSHASIGQNRLNSGEILYYKLLESILMKEKAKNKAWAILLEKDEFHRVLFAACLEIVIFSYNSPSRCFPWIINTFGLEDFYFYKVIEIIIKAEDWLNRDIVKHLQSIEEQILESRAWTAHSPLWKAIDNESNGVPSYEEVVLPDQSSGVTDVARSPISHHAARGFVVKSPMAGDRFKSPIVTALARRQLAFDGQPTTVISPIKAGQSILASPQKPVVQSPTRYAIIQPNEGVTLESDSNRPKRTGGLSLFFRKVYNLAYLRLNHLCNGLGIVDEIFKRKIWTTLEKALKDHTAFLFKGRHLDQNIMCCVYIVWKKENHKRGVRDEKIFSKIINQYKKQPQAEKHVYERVLIDLENMDQEGASGDEKPNDLIQYYNSVFVKEMMSYMTTTETNAPPLSPLPKVKVQSVAQSPIRKVSDHHSVFIRPLKANPSDEIVFNPSSPHRPLSYSFSRSPAKDLDAINAWMRTEHERKSNIGKRLLSDDNDGDEPPSTKRMLLLPTAGSGAQGGVNQKLGLIVQERAGSNE